MTSDEGRQAVAGGPPTGDPTRNPSSAERTPASPRADHAATASPRADHAAIERLVDGLLPALAARLGLGDLDEIEVREGGWRVRLRRPGTAAPPSGAAVSPSAAETTRPPERSATSSAATSLPSTGSGAPAGRGTAGPSPRSSASSLVGIGPAPGGQGAERRPPRARPRRPVTSPAVGLFRPGSGFAVGKRVRAGDRLGVVDVLGVPHDVVAPADGLVSEVVAEAGQPVEYGQELGFLEPLGVEAAAGSPPSRALSAGDAPRPQDVPGASGGR